MHAVSPHTNRYSTCLRAIHSMEMVAAVYLTRWSSMKIKLKLAVAGFAMFLFASTAQAELFSVALDIPVQYKFSQGNDADKVSGFKAAVNFPLLFGLGFEDYTATLDTGNSGGGAREVGITMFDIFLDLPTPLINIGLGAGAGTAEVVDDEASTEEFSDTTVLQAFVTLGIPIYELFDVHIGYHLIKGTADNKDTSLPNFVIDGDMLSVGVRFGF